MDEAMNGLVGGEGCEEGEEGCEVCDRQGSLRDMVQEAEGTTEEAVHVCVDGGGGEDDERIRRDRGGRRQWVKEMKKEGLDWEQDGCGMEMLAKWMVRGRRWAGLERRRMCKEFLEARQIWEGMVRVK